jgi:hypothetical protein
VMIQQGNGTNMTCTIGIGRTTDAGPNGFNRSSVFANNSGISILGSWLVRAVAGEVYQAFVTHNSTGGTVPFTNRRLAIQRVGN